MLLFLWENTWWAVVTVNARPVSENFKSLGIGVYFMISPQFFRKCEN
jgi:hypothetical protein